MKCGRSISKTWPSLLLVPVFTLGCLQPNADLWVDASSTPRFGPHGPAPDSDVYECARDNGSPCKTARARIWLPDWWIVMMGARGAKVAFCALPSSPGAPRIMHGGQVDLTTGQLDWITPLGVDQADFSAAYDAHVTPSGEVVFLGSGHGKLVVGNGGYDGDNITVAFDEQGYKQFAKRLEIWDQPPPIEYRPDFVGAATYSDDIIRIRTSYHYYPQDNPGATILAAHIFSLELDGAQTNRIEIPHTQSINFDDSQLGEDGSIWSWQAPGPIYRHAKNGQLIDTFIIDKPENLYLGIPRGFAPIDGSSVLVNISSTKGATNEVYRYDASMSRTLLFDEPKMEQFGAGEMRKGVNGSTAFFIEQGYDGVSYRIATIDAMGHRSSATTIKPSMYRFTMYDEGAVVFYRTQDLGSEIIMQPL